MMKGFAEVRDKVVAGMKHETGALEWTVEQLGRMRKRQRAKQAKGYRGKKGGRKRKWGKKDLKRSTKKG